MSAQTGVQTPRGPASRKMGDRVRYRVALWRSQPNALWMREMRQSTRLQRTPVILTVLIVVVALLMVTLGTSLSATLSPAESGNVLFHVFFSVAYFVVTLLGPALAANSIASEREGKTWEAVLLTGMRPAQIARGKFFAAYTSIGMYIVALAPVGALPFLFGGITVLEVVVAFGFLFIIALLSVAFGLALSAKAQTLRGALLVTLFLAIPMSVFFYFVGGVSLSYAAHSAWRGVSGGPPVWLPLAYGRAEFGVPYVVFLIALPVAMLTLPAWLLYEITTANLSSVTDDRAYGVKRWYLVTTPIAALSCAIPMIAVAPADVATAAVVGISLFLCHVVFCAFLFQGDALGPSRRVKLMLENAGRFRRALGPGVSKASRIQLGMSVLAIAGITLAGVLIVDTSLLPPTRQREEIAIFATYSAGFTVFVIGLAAHLRARAPNASGPRVLLLLFLFTLLALPWVIAAMTGIVGRGGIYSMSMTVAAPSPFYAIVALKGLGAGKLTPVYASAIMAAIYAALGLLFLVLAGRRSKKLVEQYEGIYAEADRRLAEEDAQIAERQDAAEEQSLADLEQPAEPEKETEPPEKETAQEDGSDG
ncbi:ABC transporter permease [Desulfobulbus sp. AH-315-M07]|nr:ABC transporter permease [Desulfobulbus sp. AH-315-M07]